MGGDRERPGSPGGVDGSDVLDLDVPGGLDFAAVCSLLQHPRRRFVVAALDNQDVRPLDALATDLYHAEVGTTAGIEVERAIDRIRISLIHVHLPVLSEHDVATFDTDSGLVQAGTAAPALASVLATMADAVQSTADD